RMEQPTLKSILAKNKPQKHIFVEELDESYYIMDGSKKRVTFDDDEAMNNEPVPPIESDEVVPHENDSMAMDNGEGEGEEEEEEEIDQTTNGDLIAEFEE
ncbi:unnamed protein product, partial [Rotaria socialis]